MDDADGADDAEATERDESDEGDEEDERDESPEAEGDADGTAGVAGPAGFAGSAGPAEPVEADGAAGGAGAGRCRRAGGTGFPDGTDPEALAGRNVAGRSGSDGKSDGGRAVTGAASSAGCADRNRGLRSRWVPAPGGGAPSARGRRNSAVVGGRGKPAVTRSGQVPGRRPLRRPCGRQNVACHPRSPASRSIAAIGTGSQSGRCLASYRTS